MSSPKLVYKFKAIPINVWEDLFAKSDMFVSKTIRKHEKPDVPWTILDHNKVGVSYNYEATIITAAFY